MDDCVFCKIVKGEIPSDVVFRDENVIVFKNIEPIATHHLLICPTKHVASFMELGEEILPMIKVTQKIINELEIKNEYKLVFNGGKYQSVPHVHMHLLSGNLEKNEDVLNKT